MNSSWNYRRRRDWEKRIEGMAIAVLAFAVGYLAIAPIL